MQTPEAFIAPETSNLHMPRPVNDQQNKVIDKTLTPLFNAATLKGIVQSDVAMKYRITSFTKGTQGIQETNYLQHD